MKEITVKLYRYDELSEQAFRHAYADWVKWEIERYVGRIDECSPCIDEDAFINECKVGGYWFFENGIQYWKDAL